jgi:hypothetical protein
MAGDPVRALVFAATHGAEGITPHVYADIVTTLRKRGCTATLTSASFEPRKLHLVVNDTSVLAHAGHDADNHGTTKWWFLCIGNKMVRINVMRTLEVPSHFVDPEGTIHFVMDIVARGTWPTHWCTAGAPKEAAPDVITTVCSSICATPLTPLSLGTLAYMSEVVFADSVLWMVHRMHCQSLTTDVAPPDLAPPDLAPPSAAPPDVASGDAGP